MNAHPPFLKPAGMPAGVDPKEWRKAVRKRIEELLDTSLRLVEALDCMEADCDLEETGDAEAWLGWTERGPGSGGLAVYFDGEAHHDLELDECDDEDGHDAEATNEDGGDINDEPEGDDERELDPVDIGETVAWSNNPDIPQEGYGWHGHDGGGERDRNSPTATA